MKSQQKRPRYTCPMHRQVIQNGAGKCPICGMNLVLLKEPGEKKVEALARHTHVLKHSTDNTNNSDNQYYCPMLCEGNKKYSKAGDCPVCGMHLVKEQKMRSGTIEYTCPMHPEITKSGPGACPICGMDLVPKTVRKDDKEEDILTRQCLRNSG